MLAVIVNYIEPGLFASAGTHGVTRPLSLKKDGIKKRNRNGSSLATSSRKSVASVTATGVACGIAPPQDVAP